MNSHDQSRTIRKMVRPFATGILVICIQLIVVQLAVANNTGYGGYVLSHQHLELANDSIPRVNPYRLILNQPSYKSNISLTAGMRGLGIGLLSSIAVAG